MNVMIPVEGTPPDSPSSGIKLTVAELE